MGAIMTKKATGDLKNLPTIMTSAPNEIKKNVLFDKNCKSLYNIREYMATEICRGDNGD
jgi:hypothetical protein